MKLGTAIKRFAPRIVATLVYYYKFRCFVSPRAEVDLSSMLEIGKGTKVGSFCKIKASNARLKIGSSVSIATGCFVAGDLEIGDYCLIGPNCTIVSGDYRTDRLEIPFVQQGTFTKGTRLGRNVLIGANSVVLGGSRIGDGVIVAAGSVVSGRIEDNTVVQGNPAKVIFRRRA